MGYSDALEYGETNVGLGMVPDKASNKRRKKRLDNQWIKCSERLPPKPPRPHQLVEYIVTIHYEDQIYSTVDVWNGVKFKQGKHVVAWQPLPPPPEQTDET